MRAHAKALLPGAAHAAARPKLQICSHTSQKYAEAHHLYRQHGPVMRRCMPVIIAFRSGRMHGFIGIAVICLLKKNIGPDFRFLQAVVFNGCSGNIDVNPADVAVFEFQAVNCADAVQDIVEGTFFRMLSASSARRLCPIFSRSLTSWTSSSWSKLPPLKSVIPSVTAVYTVVNTIIADVERSKRTSRLPYIRSFTSRLRQTFPRATLHHPSAKELPLPAALNPGACRAFSIMAATSAFTGILFLLQAAFNFIFPDKVCFFPLLHFESRFSHVFSSAFLHSIQGISARQSPGTETKPGAKSLLNGLWQHRN